MAYVDPFLPADRYVVRCYNSQQAGAAMNNAPCGITVTRSNIGRYNIDFGFNVEGRLVSVTTRTPTCCPGSGNAGGGFTVGAVFYQTGNVVGVLTSYIHKPEEGADSQFYVIVF